MVPPQRITYCKICIASFRVCFAQIPKQVKAAEKGKGSSSLIMKRMYRVKKSIYKT